MRAWSQSRLPCLLSPLLHASHTRQQHIFACFISTDVEFARVPTRVQLFLFFFFCFLFFYYASLRGKNQRCTTKLTEQLSAWSAKHHKTARLPFPCCRFRWECLGSLRQHCHPSPSHSVPLSEGTDAKTSDTYTLKAHSKLIFHHRTLDLSPQE